MRLITLMIFDFAINAHLAKAKLASENIDSYLFDENVVGLNPLYSIALGGIKLKVKEKDYDRASEVIANTLSAAITDENGEILKCTICQSQEFYHNYNSMKGIKGFLSMVLSFLLSTYPIYYKSVNKCKICGHEFELN